MLFFEILEKSAIWIVYVNEIFLSIRTTQLSADVWVYSLNTRVALQDRITKILSVNSNVWLCNIVEESCVSDIDLPALQFLWFVINDQKDLIK